MLGFIKAVELNPVEDRYNKLRKAAKKAYSSGDFQRYKALVAETNHTLIEMFSSGKNIDIRQ